MFTPNFLWLYRSILTGISLYNLVTLSRSILQYKTVYERVPKPVRQVALKLAVHHGGKLVGRALQIHRRDVLINLGLFGVLVVLTIVGWLI